MIRWTRAGAVAEPTTVQVRVQRSYPGRVRAGAPVPTRSMTPEEVADNILYFTEGLSGPRTRPCDGLVLSGVGVASRPDTPDQVALAVEHGVRRIVLHAGIEDLEGLDLGRFGGRVGLLVVPIRPGGGTLAAAARALAAARDAGVRVVANTVLTEQAVEALDGAVRLLANVRPHRVVFTYPFPLNGGAANLVPPPPRALAALRRALPVLDAAGVDAEIKGLPACHLGPEARRLRRTRNRYYVDADHQRERALLFFPDVVAFHKEEVCRFCAAVDLCDGFFAAYLRRPAFPPLTPLDEVPWSSARA